MLLDHTNLDTPQSVGLLWASDEPHAEISYLTTHNSYKRQTSMLPAGFKCAIPAGERPQTHALYRAVTGIGEILIYSATIRLFL